MDFRKIRAILLAMAEDNDKARKQIAKSIVELNIEFTASQETLVMGLIRMLEREEEMLRDLADRV